MNEEKENSDSKYVILMETNGEELESWYYFIKFENNEKALKYLKDQIEKIEMYIIDDLSTFDIDLEHRVSNETAKEMTKVELNSITFHRKFDGKLQMINIGLKKKDNNVKKIEKINDKIGMGTIDDYIDSEDIDEEDLVTSSDEDDEDLVPLPLIDKSEERVENIEDSVRKDIVNDENEDEDEDEDKDKDKDKDKVITTEESKDKRRRKKKKKKKKR